MAHLKYNYPFRTTGLTNNHIATLFWAILGFLYAVIVIYWPIIQEIFPSGFGFLRVFDIYALLLLGITIIRVLMRGKAPELNSRTILFGLFLIFITRLISVLFSPHSSFELIWSVFRYAETIALIWVFIALRSTVFGRNVVYGLIVITLFETFVGIGQVTLSGGTRAGTGFASGRGVYELQILLTLLGLIGLSAGEGSRLMNILKIITGVTGVIITAIRTSFIQIIIAVFATYWLMPGLGRRNYGRIVILGSIAAIILVGLVGLQWSLLEARIGQIGTMSGTIGVRLVLWETALVAFKLYPVTGIGSGAFARNQDVYMDGAGIGFKEGYNDVGLSAHNTVVGFLAETGTIGLVAYFVYAIGTSKIAWRLSRTVPSVFNIALAGTVVSGLILDIIAASSFYPITITLVALLASKASAHFTRERV